MNTETLHTKTEKQFLPQLRFAEFEGNKLTKHIFQDIFHFSTGKNIKQSEASPGFEIPCVRYGELYHMYNEVIHEVINKTNLNRSELKFSEGDEILLPSAGEDPLDIGSASALTISNIAIGRTINILKPQHKSVYSQVFVSFYINQILKRKIASLAKGVSISNVYNSDLKGLKIILPSLPEQKKIASFLTSVDAKLQQLTQKKELLAQYKKGVMQQLFSQQLRFKQSVGSDYPDWEEKKLEEVFKAFRGKGIPKGEVVPEGKNQCILYGELYTHYNEVIYEVISKTDSNDGLLSKKGDLLVPSSTTTTGIDLANVTALRFDDVHLGGDIIVLRSKRNVSNIFYAYYLTNNKKFAIASRAQGITIVHLYFSGIKDILIDVPSVEEQQKIANYLSALDTKIDSVTQQITQTQQFKKGLLQQLFV